MANNEVASTSSNVKQPASLRVAGAWSGQVDVPLDDWTIADLRAHLAVLSGFPVDSINLICAGKNLKDETGYQNLSQVGIRPNSKLLMTRVGAQQASSLMAEKARLERLARIRAAADAMAKRSNEDAYPVDDFDFQLENQSGEKLRFNSDSDRRALVIGLMLHAKGRELVKQEQYMEALEVLGMAEEAFSLCDRKILEAVDNVALLQIDMVWCYFMIKDLACLSVAGKRLSQARDGLRQSHGSQLERLRVLQGGFCPELAIYVRMELLEGVVAFHSGLYEAARKALVSAQRKYHQLQVSDESLALLAGMGFKAKESRRALRASGQDLNNAIEFVMEEKRKKSQKGKEDRLRQEQRREQRLFGKTLAGKAVDLTKVNDLVSIGYERKLAAEALRQSENDTQIALDILTDPVTNSAIQSTLSPQGERQHANEAAIAELTAMGFERERVVHALRNTGDRVKALNELLEGGQSSLTDARPSSSTASRIINTRKENEPIQEGGSSEPQTLRDEEMEEEIARNLTGDPLAEYDIEVEKEGEAIAEYLVMLDTAMSS